MKKKIIIAMSLTCVMLFGGAMFVNASSTCKVDKNGIHKGGAYYWGPTYPLNCVHCAYPNCNVHLSGSKCYK